MSPVYLLYILLRIGYDIPPRRKYFRDVDKDGQLDLNEFVIAMYLSDFVKAGNALPGQLDPDMVPLEKR